MNGQIAFIKPANYEISKTRKCKNDISRIENMEYDKEIDCYTYKNNKKLTVERVLTRTTKTGYRSEKTIYKCEDCSNCPHKEKCIKGNNRKVPLNERTKRLETSKLFMKQREEDLARITSEEGCRLRMN